MSSPENTNHTSLAHLFDLHGKVALITGGAAGIGLSIARRLGEAGAAVMVADVDDEHGAQAVASLEDQGVRAAFTKADLSQTAGAQDAVRQTVEHFGQIDILVNNAGVFPFAPVDQLTEPLWDRVLDINLKGAFFCAQAATEAMKAAGKGGRIVNISSVDSFRPTGALAHYDASKAAINALTRALALELGPAGITVNAIAPGAITTPGAAAASQSMLRAGIVTEEQLNAQGERFAQAVPLRRMGQPDDIAKAVVFLASQAADYITGTVLVVDGGLLLIPAQS